MHVGDRHSNNRGISEHWLVIRFAAYTEGLFRATTDPCAEECKETKQLPMEPADLTLDAQAQTAHSPSFTMRGGILA